jgi:Tfp pilus assembly protein PilX
MDLRFMIYESGKLKANRGQAGLIVMLIMVVLLTVGISIAARSSSDVGLSRQEEEASRAFDAAEAGIEKALEEIGTGTFSESGTVDITGITTSYSIGEEQTLNTRVIQGHVAQVDVSNASGGETVRISWAKNQNCDTNAASVIVAIYNHSGANYTVRREAYAACDHSDNFETSGVVDGSGGYFKSVPVGLVSGDQIMRVMPVYNDTDILVEGSGGYNLPVQYYKVRSEATHDVGGETKVVEVTRTLPAIPSIFDYVLFSGTSIVK